MNETESKACLDFWNKLNCWAVQNMETESSLLTTNSYFFPHIHALCKGEWTFKRYPTLQSLIQSYGVPISNRKINTWWELDYQ